MMTSRQALEVLVRHRGGRVVLTTMTAVGLWPQLSDTPLDFAYIPSAMGHAPSLGLGLALAQPDRGVIVVNGDGSLLMNLGCLVTLAATAAKLCLIVLDNGLYEVTGGQPTPNAGRVDFAGLARAAGLPRVHAFESLGDWERSAPAILSVPGPAFVCLKVEGRLGQKTPAAPRPMAEQIARLKAGLGVS
jgi:thiamine pyrophosphate-dependent acetolactate synthase large subunit-like protein